MAWLYLVLAGLMEIGWPVGLKLAWNAQDQSFRITPALGAGACMLASGFFLYLAQRDIPMGTAYAVWTGIGSVGAFLVGLWVFDDPNQLARWLCVGLIAGGIVGLKLTASH